MNCLCFNSTKRLTNQSSCQMSVKYGSPTQLIGTTVPIFHDRKCTYALFFSLATCTLLSMVQSRNLLLQMPLSRPYERKRINMPLLSFLVLWIHFINKRSPIAPRCILCGHSFMLITINTPKRASLVFRQSTTTASSMRESLSLCLGFRILCSN